MLHHSQSFVHLDGPQLEIIDLESARIGYKSLNRDAPSYMSDMFTKVNVSTTRSLRNSDASAPVRFTQIIMNLFENSKCGLK